jgi:hypothetical protein
MSEKSDFINQLSGVVKEMDALIRKLKEKDRKLLWEIDFLEEKREKSQLTNKNNENNENKPFAFFSFSAENQDFSKQKEALLIREKTTSKEKMALELKEKELNAKFAHMKEFYNEFLNKKSDFERKTPKKRLNLKENSDLLQKEVRIKEKERVLCLKEESLEQKSAKLKELLGKLNVFYEDYQNYQSERVNSQGLPKIQAFEAKKADFIRENH